MFKVGAVDIDTSHPVEFAGIMKKNGRAAYTCVYNAGFRSDEYVEKFMREKDIAVRCKTLDEMAAQVDIAFIHSCNWDKHLELAQPFVDAGKPVFIDKPMVGNLADCHKLEGLVKSGAVILGGSAFRHCGEFKDFLDQPLAERGEILSLFGSVGVDEFNYGIHVIESLDALIPKGAKCVRCIYSGAVELYEVTYNNGVKAVYQLCTGIWRPTVIVATTTCGTYVIQPAVDKLYSSLLTAIFDSLEKSAPFVPVEALTESIKIALAARSSREQGGLEVKLKDLTLDDPGYDGQTFEASYAQASS